MLLYKQSLADSYVVPLGQRYGQDCYQGDYKRILGRPREKMCRLKYSTERSV